MIVWLALYLLLRHRVENPLMWSGVLGLVITTAFASPFSAFVYLESFGGFDSPIAAVEMAFAHLIILSWLFSLGSLALGVASDFLRDVFPPALREEPPRCLEDVVSKYVKTPKRKDIGRVDQNVNTAVAQSERAVGDLAPDNAEASSGESAGKEVDTPASGEERKPDGD